ncbi:serine/threonine protein kinase [Mesorhizobium sp. B2-4-19]|uniref:serine/threonine-protein kinase n=1 Tax=Mesorhizobium sp. B2-4-19 TaxID=2589930 RepID=UPI0011276B16|nr:serine/threonine-protein kinase [Mesorhizobium sp. B2-4-19]TPK61662.1 serine/threonine protein kinase [Mesorhizobium sp. B2-4-19]
MKGPISTGAPTLAERYVPKHWIGAGGMQHVYVAFDVLFERNVALKTPKDDAGVKRFKQSAVVSARVNHQNVAKTLDYFEEGDRPYLVEELVPDKDLFAVMAGNLPYLPPSTCARIFHQLAKGLAASHAADVVHRDLKPSNIMVVGGALFHDVKITDFGIAKMAEEEIGQWAEVGGATSSKTVLGAIPYMSPEAINDFKVAKKSSDVWAIAAIIYELLSGELPFGTGLKSIPKIVDAVPPKKPSLLNGAQFKTLGGQLYDIILQCLDKDVTKRPTAKELVGLCEILCYGTTTYSFGTVTHIPGVTGRILDEKGSVLMWHPKCFYGSGSVTVGSRVWFGRDSGQPWDRAFPIVKAIIS